MRAEIVSIGTELLLGQITDTNAAELGRFFADIGLDHTARQTVGDNLPRIVEALRLALSRADIVFTIGGLGPTPDDITRQAIADAMGVPLIRDEALVQRLYDLYGARGLAMTESQFRQADRPDCATAIENPNGTAPGLHAAKDGKHIIALPGPKNEFGPMVAGPVRAIIAALQPGDPIFSRTLRVCGISEASIGEQLSDLMAANNPTVAPYAKTGEVHLRISTRAADLDGANLAIDPVAAEIRTRFGTAVYAEGEETLEQWIVRTLQARAQKVTVAESCTAGLLAARITNAEGSSTVFETGLVTYSAESKIAQVGVRQETLATTGTVSEETAREMAVGAQKKFGADYAVSITGVAGEIPVIEPPEPKPSGLIYIGIASPNSVEVHKLNLRGNRSSIRDRAVSQALIRLRDALLLGVED